MKYSFSAFASRAAVTALFSVMVAIGSAMPVSASPSTDAGPEISTAAAQSIVSLAERAFAGPVHPIVDFLLQLI